MLKCNKCSGRMFVDRLYSVAGHIETYCIMCGSRKFFHPPTESQEGTWLLQKEILRAKRTMSHL